MPGKSWWPLLLVVALYFGGRAWYFRPVVQDTETAPDFAAVRPDGRPFRLSDYRGRYVLLDFWGSWCGPCRRESPALVDLQRRYADRLTLISIAIERDSAAWMRARTQDARVWPEQAMEHSASLRFLSGPISDVYGVRKVPTAFLISPAGEVLAVDPDLAAIPDLLRGADR